MSWERLCYLTAQLLWTCWNLALQGHSEMSKGLIWYGTSITLTASRRQPVVREGRGSEGVSSLTPKFLTTGQLFSELTRISRNFFWFVIMQSRRGRCKAFAPCCWCWKVRLWEGDATNCWHWRCGFSHCYISWPCFVWALDSIWSWKALAICTSACYCF